MRKIKIRLPVGRRSIPLEEGLRTMILKIIREGNLTCKELSKKMGLSYAQLRNPLVGTGNCSAESYRKITRWLERNAK